MKQEKNNSQDTSTTENTFQKTLLNQVYQVIDYWFFKYNPLYFFSAFCVLIGVYLISTELGDNWVLGNLALTGVIQLYEMLVILSVVLLSKIINQYRPAVFLTLLELVFLFDCTLRIEIISVSDLGVFAGILILLWILLVIAKLIILGRAFELQHTSALLLVGTLSAVGIGVVPYLPEKAWIYLLANWYGVIPLAVMFLSNKTITCSRPLDKWGQLVLSRCVIAAWSFMIGFYFCHLWLKILSSDSSSESATMILLLIASFIALIGFKSDEELSNWVGGIGALVLTAVFLPLITYGDTPLVSYMSFFVTLLFCWRAWFKNQRTLFVGALLSLYIGCITPYWPTLLSGGLLKIVSAVATLGFAFLAWKLKSKLAYVILVAIMVVTLKLVLTELVPRTAFGWGILFVSIGFIALLVGVTISWLQRKHDYSEKEVTSQAQEPEKSVTS